ALRLASEHAVQGDRASLDVRARRGRAVRAGPRHRSAGRHADRARLDARADRSRRRALRLTLLDVSRHRCGQRRGDRRSPLRDPANLRHARRDPARRRLSRPRDAAVRVVHRRRRRRDPELPALAARRARRRGLTPMRSSAQALVLVLLLGAGAALAAPLTLEETVTLRRVTSAKLSPDGTRIAYVLQVPRTPYVDDAGAAYAELHVADLDGDSRGYVTGKVNVRQVEWSADGAKLLFLARRDGDEHVSLYEIPIDGGEARRRYQHHDDIQSMHPSPVDSRVALIAPVAAPEREDELRE